MSNTLKWNLYREFTEEESVELIMEDELYYVAPMNYQELGNEVEVKFDKDLEADSSRSSEYENQSEQDEETVNDENSTSNETVTKDKDEKPKKWAVKASILPMAKSTYPKNEFLKGLVPALGGPKGNKRCVRILAISL